MYGFPIIRSIKFIVREAVVKFALSATRTPKDAAGVLGITERQLKEEIERFKINPKECNYEVSEDTN